MKERLEKIKARYVELTELISDSAVISNQEKYRESTKELSEITPIIKMYDELLSLERSLSETEEIASSTKDPEMVQLAKQEIQILEGQISEREEGLKSLLIPKDPDDGKDVILEIRSGTGGEEAALFAADLYRMYSKFADKRGWRIETLDFNETGIGGFKEIILGVSGKNVYGDLKYESGVHGSSECRQLKAAAGFTPRQPAWRSCRKLRKLN